MTQAKSVIGIIGGSGLYRMDDLQNIRENTIDTPFGKPSDTILTGQIDGVPVAFLAATAALTPFCLAKFPTGPISTP